MFRSGGFLVLHKQINGIPTLLKYDYVAGTSQQPNMVSNIHKARDNPELVQHKRKPPKKDNQTVDSLHVIRTNLGTNSMVAHFNVPIALGTLSQLLKTLPVEQLVAYIQTSGQRDMYCHIQIS